jgi:hypothetical protein
MEKFFRCYYYKLYDNKTRPVVNVCLIEKDGIWCRGIAICHPIDYGFLKNSEGRHIAINRALSAWMMKKNSYPAFLHLDRGRDTSMRIFDLLFQEKFKSGYDVVLMDYELLQINKQDAKRITKLKRRANVSI